MTMTPNEYLKSVLESQKMKPGCAELVQLEKNRVEVEAVLRKAFGDGPTIRYGGSKAKGTMIRESYDLDIACYFPHDDTSAGETLHEIYENVRKSLEKAGYVVEPKGSALRIKNASVDFHVDVVPGRFVDDKKEDANLHRSTGEKDWLKTNLKVHIAHVRDSGVTDAVMLLKLWRARQDLHVKGFVFDLSIIDSLSGKSALPLDEQLEHVLTTYRDDIDALTVEDPANPSGNDLSDDFDDAVKSMLADAAAAALDLVEEGGWEAVYGRVTPVVPDLSRRAAIERAAASAVPVKPWSPGA